MEHLYIVIVTLIISVQLHRNCNIGIGWQYDFGQIIAESGAEVRTKSSTLRNWVSSPQSLTPPLFRLTLLLRLDLQPEGSDSLSQTPLQGRDSHRWAGLPLHPPFIDSCKGPGMVLGHQEAEVERRCWPSDNSQGRREGNGATTSSWHAGSFPLPRMSLS